MKPSESIYLLMLFDKLTTN